MSQYTRIIFFVPVGRNICDLEIHNVALSLFHRETDIT